VSETPTLKLGARLIVAGTSSGVGKTTVATGLMAAFRRRGVTVASAKVGPDFIDPGYHALATGQPARNLDAWLSGEVAIPGLAARAAQAADLLIIEGVMGLFDGSGSSTEASTAHIARLLDAPVILVVDASAMSGSVAALVHGFATFDPTVRIKGVVLNQVGSPGHETLLREALAPLGIPVVGAVHRDSALTWRDRHLGLVPVVERPQETRAALHRLAVQVTDRLDLDAILTLARHAPEVAAIAPASAQPVGVARVAVAAGPAFSFTYPDNLEALRQAGAELLPFDPRTDRRLPEGAEAMVVGGGFPEVYAASLSDNQPLIDDVRASAAAGLVIWAECGGLLWLANSLDGHPLCGVIPTEARMTDRLTLGYRSATTTMPTPLGEAGTALRGHEFHYSTVDPAGEGLDLRGRFGSGRAGWASPALLASYLHVHLGATPQLAERFVRAAAGRPQVTRPGDVSTSR
jgi:cobyrinic acid a,c-diamide synthase